MFAGKAAAWVSVTSRRMGVVGDTLAFLPGRSADVVGLLFLAAGVGLAFVTIFSKRAWFGADGVAGASLVGVFISACGNLVVIAGERGFESWLLCIVGVR